MTVTEEIIEIPEISLPRGSVPEHIPPNRWFQDGTWSRGALECLYGIGLFYRRLLLTPICWITGAVGWILVTVGAGIAGCFGCEYMSQTRIIDTFVWWMAGIPGWHSTHF